MSQYLFLRGAQQYRSPPNKMLGEPRPPWLPASYATSLIDDDDDLAYVVMRKFTVPHPLRCSGRSGLLIVHVLLSPEPQVSYQ